MCNQTIHKDLKCQQGFSLIEIALALAIFAFLAYGLASIVLVDRDYNNHRENKELMQKAKNSLLAYVQTNGFLPCPDQGGDGVQDRNANTTCAVTSGFLPYVDLGVAERDPWGNPLLYSVNPNADTLADYANVNNAASYFNNTGIVGQPFFTLATPPFSDNAYNGALFVCGENAAVCGAATGNQDLVEIAALAVIVGYGKNGTNSWTNYPTANTTTIVENENLDNDTYFLRARGSNNDTTGFDDEVVWINGFDVKFAMVRSGDSLGD